MYALLLRDIFSRTRVAADTKGAASVRINICRKEVWTERKIKKVNGKVMSVRTALQRRRRIILIINYIFYIGTCASFTRRSKNKLQYLIMCN